MGTDTKSVTGKTGSQLGDSRRLPETPSDQQVRQGPPCWLSDSQPQERCAEETKRCHQIQRTRTLYEWMADVRLIRWQVKKIEDVVYDLSLRNLIPRNV